MNKQQYKEKIQMFEETVNPNCFVEIKNMQMKKDVIVADIFLQLDRGNGETVPYRDCKYKRKELENDTIFMRS